ncbi:MAG: hypothetical protein K6E37_04650 [Bacteroidales bacterium]|nr:hypothetical protein [Bacteroidales bacterium]
MIKTITPAQIQSHAGISSTGNRRIAQQGTLLSLDVTYKFDFYTRFQPGRDYRVYRYRVLIDGWEYSTGAVKSESQKVSIPIMANDTHVAVTIEIG